MLLQLLLKKYTTQISTTTHKTKYLSPKNPYDTNLDKMLTTPRRSPAEFEKPSV